MANFRAIYETKTGAKFHTNVSATTAGEAKEKAKAKLANSSSFKKIVAVVKV
ncbi:MAG: hypothetical protein FWE23_06130 [Chitinivibrionia bacterium]|nr:hypothetical protein [Chitinivibrionia bacterium]